MAVLRIVGFETGDTVEIAQIAGTGSVQSATKRTGDYAFQANPTTTGIGYVQVAPFLATGAIKTGGLAATDSYSTFYWRIGTLPSAADEELWVLSTNGSANFVGLRVTSAGALKLYNDELGTPSVIETSTATVTTGVWYRIEIRVQPGTSGAYSVAIDGATALSGTANFGTGTITNWYVGKVLNKNGESVNFYYDDISISDTAFAGEGEVHRMDADGNGTDTAWTGTFADVDENPPDGDTTYVTTSTDNADETVTLESASSAGISGDIKAISTVSVVRDEGAASSIAGKIRSGATSDETDGSDPGPTYQIRGKVYELNPDDSGAWEGADLDALQVGVAAGTTNALRCTHMSVMVWSTGATPVVITPGVLAHSTTMFIPSVILGTVITPDVLSLSDTQYAPNVQTPRLVTPDTISLALTEYPPVITVGISVIPGVLALTDTEYEPTVSTPVAVTPGVLVQTLSEKIPSAIIGTVVEPGVLAHVITPLIPDIVEGQSVVPDTLALTLSELVPVVTATDNKSISPGLATLTLSSFIPVLTTGTVITPGVIDLVISLYVPSAFASYLAEYVHTQLRSLGIETDLYSVQQITDLLIKKTHTQGEFV